MANPVQGNTSSFPQIGTPLVDENRSITSTWLQLLLLLFKRTGGGQGVPGVAGDISLYAGSIDPAGRLICDGRTLSASDPAYAQLFAAIGTTYGSGGAGTFKIPNAQGRTVVGVGAGFALGDVGGAVSHVIGKANLPNYALTVVDPGHIHSTTDPQHHHTAPVLANNVTTGLVAGGVTAGVTGDSSTGVTINPAVTGIGVTLDGGEVALPTISPYIVMNYTIKY